MEQVLGETKTPSRDRTLQGTTEHILDVLVPDMVEQLVKLLNTVSQDRIRQQTVEHIVVDIPVLQVAEELVEVSKVFPKDRVQQSSAEQTVETPDITLGEKIVEGPVTQTPQVVNTDVQHVVNTVEAEMLVTQFTDKVVDVPVVARRQISMVLTVQENIEISQLQITDEVIVVPVVSVMQVPRVLVVKKTVEDPQFEIVEKTVENPETLISDVVIDTCLTCDAKCKVACETCVKDNMFMVAGEITVAPKRLNFVEDVVDSEDLHLNVYRETLRQNKILRVIKMNLAKKKCLEMLAEIAEKKDDDYKKFYEQFDKLLCLGIHEAKLLRFNTSKSGVEQISFEEWVDRMKEGQNDIYCITDESTTVVSSSSFRENFRKKGYEVLYMADPVDEFAVQQPKEFDGAKPKLTTKEGLDLGDQNEKKSLEDAETTLAEQRKEMAARGQADVERVQQHTGAVAWQRQPHSIKQQPTEQTGQVEKEKGQGEREKGERGKKEKQKEAEKGVGEKRKKEERVGREGRKERN